MEKVSRRRGSTVPLCNIRLYQCRNNENRLPGLIGESIWQWSSMIDAAVEEVARINVEWGWKEICKSSISHGQCLSSLHLKLQPLTKPFSCCSTTIIKFSSFSITIISMLTFFTVTPFLCPSNVGPPLKDLLGLCINKKPIEVVTSAKRLGLTISNNLNKSGTLT